MRFLVIELDGAILDRAQHRLQGFIGKRETIKALPRVQPPRRWVGAWEPAKRAAPAAP